MSEELTPGVPGDAVAPVGSTPAPTLDSKFDDDPGFAPGDLTDGRKPWEWRSRWPREARKMMLPERIALGVLLVLGVAGFLVGYDNSVARAPDSFLWSLLAIWGAGLTGGTSFAVKWFYHVVAKGLWNADRRDWRFFTPFVSSVLASVVTLALLGDSFFAKTIEDVRPLVVKASLCAFLAGYFSDSAYAKLAEISRVIFGVTEKHSTPDDAGGKKPSGDS